MKKFIGLSFMLVAMLLFSGLVAAEGVLVFSESFENAPVGEVPEGWELVHTHAGLVVDASTVSIPHGQKALQLNSTPNDMGEVRRDFPEVRKGKLVVEFYQPSHSRDNINIEIRNENARLVGVFITGSGNVRPRDNGVQTANLINLPNDNWHTFVIRWDVDEQIFHVAYMEGEREVAITGAAGAGFDPAGVGLPGSRVMFNVSRRDPAKEAFIDNVRIYDLAP